MSSGDTEYGLIMPFVVCESRGGPYEDDPFVAGLIAMQHGWSIKCKPWESYPEWSFATFTRTKAGTP